MKNGPATTLSSQRRLKGTAEVTDFNLEILVFCLLESWVVEMTSMSAMLGISEDLGGRSPELCVLFKEKKHQANESLRSLLQPADKVSNE